MLSSLNPILNFLLIFLYCKRYTIYIMYINRKIVCIDFIIFIVYDNYNTFHIRPEAGTA
jgi:hypothetical protein